MNPMPESTPTPIITAAGTGTIWNVVGDNITCKVSGDQTQGAYAVVEEMSPPQGGPALHLHRRTDEICYILHPRRRISGRLREPHIQRPARHCVRRAEERASQPPQHLSRDQSSPRYPHTWRIREVLRTSERHYRSCEGHGNREAS